MDVAKLATHTKPEPNMPKTLPIIPSSTFQKICPLFLFYFHIITYYSYFILFKPGARRPQAGAHPVS